MNLAHLLAEAIARLERAEIPYMVTGSLASTYHGEPRATLDLDIVIDPRPSALERLLEDLEAGGFYVDRDAARTALRERTQFNAVGDAAAKVDFIIRKDRPFPRPSSTSGRASWTSRAGRRWTSWSWPAPSPASRADVRGASSRRHATGAH